MAVRPTLPYSSEPIAISAKEKPDDVDAQVPSSAPPDMTASDKGFLSSLFASAAMSPVIGSLLTAMASVADKPSDIESSMWGVILSAGLSALTIMLVAAGDIRRGDMDSAASTCSFSTGMATTTAAAFAFLAVAPATPLIVSVGAGVASAVNLALAYQSAATAYNCAEGTLEKEKDSWCDRLNPKKVLAGIMAGSVLSAAAVLGPGIYVVNSTQPPSPATSHETVSNLSAARVAHAGDEMHLAGHVFTVPGHAPA